MKQMFFDIDSEQEIDNLKELLIRILSIDGTPTPKVIVHDVPDNMEIEQ